MLTTCSGVCTLPFHALCITTVLTWARHTRAAVRAHVHIRVPRTTRALPITASNTPMRAHVNHHSTGACLMYVMRHGCPMYICLRHPDWRLTTRTHCARPVPAVAHRASVLHLHCTRLSPLHAHRRTLKRPHPSHMLSLLWVSIPGLPITWRPPRTRMHRFIYRTHPFQHSTAQPRALRYT